MATIGRSDAVVQFPRGFKMKGTAAWLVWMSVHIIMLMSNRNRLASLANLSVRYFGWPRGVNAIVGDMRQAQRGRRYRHGYVPLTAPFLGLPLG